mmetsp:Transcript_88236/g.159097  ORF Transcript_88236/g.159097 Transcript_88236/m.159097 type:complete len:91 (-) Transcript_88236:222-494(-)
MAVMLCGEHLGSTWGVPPPPASLTATVRSRRQFGRDSGGAGRKPRQLVACLAAPSLAAVQTLHRLASSSGKSGKKDGRSREAGSYADGGG